MVERSNNPKDEPNWIQRLRASPTVDEVGLSPWVIFLQRFFKLKQRNTTIKREIHCGILHFISVAFILSVNSTLLSENANYQSNKVAASTALSTGISCLICGVLSNLPFVLAPTTSTSLYYALYMQNHNMTVQQGNMAVLLIAVLFTLCGFRPVALFISNLIPFVMKVGVCLGVGLLIALEALYEIGLVQTGEHTVLDIGQFNTEIYIAMFSFIIIGLALHYRTRGAFLIGMVCGTFLYWIAMGKRSEWPPSRITIKNGDIRATFHDIAFDSASSAVVLRLVFDLYVIGVILLNGLAHGLAETALLKRPDNTLPRGKWLYASCGMGTLLSAFIGSGPIMISPESAPGIKAGARTGLSTVVCGLCFLLSLVFCPLFAAVPTSGTSPILLMIGMFMFENAGKVEWSNIREALPVFIMAIFVPFTYSIFNGVIFGFGVYLVLLLCTDASLLTKKLRCCRKKLLPTVVTRHIRSWGSWSDPTKLRSLSLSGSMDRRSDNLDTSQYTAVGQFGEEESVMHGSLNITSPSRKGKQEAAQASVGGKWKSLVHQPGHLAIKELDSDDDNDENGQDNDDKTLSFSLSAIGDQLQDRDEEVTNNRNPMNVIDFEDSNRTRFSQYVPPSATQVVGAATERMADAWNSTRQHLGSGSVPNSFADQEISIVFNSNLGHLQSDDSDEAEVVL